jgi:hypothetical protein
LKVAVAVAVAVGQRHHKVVVVVVVVVCLSLPRKALSTMERFRAMAATVETVPDRMKPVEAVAAEEVIS